MFICVYLVAQAQPQFAGVYMWHNVLNRPSTSSSYHYYNQCVIARLKLRRWYHWVLTSIV